MMSSKGWRAALASVGVMMSSIGGAQVAAAQEAPTAYPGGKWQPGPARYGYTIANEVPVTMDDGTVLRASIAWPTDLATGKKIETKFPVIVEHTPYVHLGQPVSPNTFLVEHGYIYAVVRARGMGTSGGEVTDMSVRDGADGKKLIDWAAHEIEGSDGRVGLLGCSYPGALSLVDTAHVGPDSPLKVVVSACVGLNATNREAQLNNGMVTAGFWNYAVNGLNYWGNSEAGARYVEQYKRDVEAGTERMYEGNYWRDRTNLGWARQIADTKVPVLLWAGWGDIVENMAVRTYSALQNAYAGRPLFQAMQPGQKTTPRYQLIMGNWGHADGLDAGIYLEWLDTWLKGVDTGIQNTATPMHLYEPGSERWVNVTGLPAGGEASVLALGAENTLGAPTGAGTQNARLVWGDPDKADGKLSFTSAPIAAGLTISGPISATIYASSSNTNLQLVGHLFDVAPDGTATLVSDGAMMGSLRTLDKDKSWTDKKGVVTWPWPTLVRDEYLVPGKLYRFDMPMAVRHWGIAPGHSLRFELTSQSARSICPDQGLPPRNVPDPCGLTGPQKATLPGGTYSISLGGKNPSSINLTQIPWQALPAVRAGISDTQWSENQRRLRDPAKGDKLFPLPIDWGAAPR